MNEQIKKTAFESSAATDESSLLSISTNSITENEEICKSDEDIFADLGEENNPNFIQTYTLDELFDKDFEARKPIIQDLLYQGMYLFVGSPKIGKSFAMMQMAHHISCGIDLWGKKVHRGKVVYLALEDREDRIVSRYYMMYGVPSIERTISISIGKGSVNHNSRVFNANNTDPKRSHLNIEYVNDDIEAVYHELFNDALKRYNDKQPRNDRKISNYYEKICNSKQEKTFHEIVVQIGDCHNTGVKTYEGEVATRILDEYYKAFQERNPYLRVFSAHLHLDEATPHLHIDFVPFTTGSKRGLDTRVSLKKALEKQGFVGKGKEETEWSLWVTSEKEVLSEVMWKHNVEWEQKGTHEKHLSVLDYKKQEREKEVDELTREVNALKSTVNSLSDLQDMMNIPKSLDTPEYQLPEPERFMSAKSYKALIEPLFEKLKGVVKTVLTRYFKLVSYINSKTEKINDLYYKNEDLKSEVNYLTKENTRLRKEANAFRLLCKAFGKKQISDLLEQAKQTKNRNYER